MLQWRIFMFLIVVVIANWPLATFASTFLLFNNNPLNNNLVNIIKDSYTAGIKLTQNINDICHSALERFIADNSRPAMHNLFTRAKIVENPKLLKPYSNRFSGVFSRTWEIVF